MSVDAAELARRAIITGRILGKSPSQVINVTRDLGSMTEAEARVIRRAVFEVES
jgi:hypothetical protein